MFTNVRDLSRFIIAFMNGGKLDGKQVLARQVIAELSTPQVSIPSQPGAKYGYGLMISNYRGVRVVEHGGSRSGYGSVIKMAPDHRFAVIVLGNRTGVALNKTAEKAMELMLPLKPKEAETPKQEQPMTAAEMANYAGKYGQREVSVEILLKDGKLFLKQGPTETPIRKVGENRFAAAALSSSTPMEFTLVPGADGKAEYFHAGLLCANSAPSASSAVQILPHLNTLRTSRTIATSSKAGPFAFSAQSNAGLNSAAFDTRLAARPIDSASFTKSISGSVISIPVNTPRSADAPLSARSPPFKIM
jgi:hypothetical protein